MSGSDNRKDPFEQDFSILPRSPSEALEPGRAPDPPDPKAGRKASRILSVINTLLALVLIGMIGLAGGFYYVKHQFDSGGPLRATKVIVIPKGTGLSKIARELEKEKVIDHRWIFVASVYYFRAQTKLKAGEYEFRPGTSMRRVLDSLVHGKSILYKVTIPEGFTSYQIVQRLKRQPKLRGEIKEIPPEGSLLPDTYAFSLGTDRSELIRRMQQRHRQFVAKMWPKRVPGLPFATPYEAIILASIVEKETGLAEERARIAGVFINRLRKKIRLQSDPTIIYGLLKGRGKLGRGLKKSELKKKTPYNTYAIRALPPTPIANPGRAAIEAVLNPMDTDEIYFVADGTGGHIFSRTLKEHRANVKKWRAVERERRKQRALAEAERRKKAAEQQDEATKADDAVPDDVKAESSAH